VTKTIPRLRLKDARLALSATLVLFPLCPSASAQQPKFVIFDAPGADTTPGDYNGTYPTGINNLGAITGYYIDANDVYHGFLRSPVGKLTSFEAPGADTTPGSFNGTSPGAINDVGAIAGSYGDANGVNHGFLRSPDGKFTTFDVPGAGGYGSFPIGLNIEGAVVGYYTDSDFVFYAFLRTPDGNFKTFGGPGQCDTGTSTGCYGSGAFTINLWGTTVGGYMDSTFAHHGLIRNLDGTLRTFDVPGAGTGSDQGTGCPGCGTGLNLLGFIAGTYIDANSVQHGFVRSPNGKFTTFDAPGAGTESGQGTGCPSDCATSLNDLGAITSNYIDANYVLHGYVRSPQGKIATVDPSGSIFTWSSGINNPGAITGYYVDGNYVYHGFLRIP
jgi:hypothetical protein